MPSKHRINRFDTRRLSLQHTRGVETSSCDRPALVERKINPGGDVSASHGHGKAILMPSLLAVGGER